jgi:hypothetical protein
MANPFDQFDATPTAQGNPFDRFDETPSKSSSTANINFKDMTPQQRRDYNNERLKFAKEAGTRGTSLREQAKAAFSDPAEALTGPTAPATSLGDMLTRVAPESIGKLAPRTLGALYQQGKSMVTPYIDAGKQILDGAPVLPAIQQGAEGSLRATGEGLYNLADFATERIGLQGLDKAKEGFLADPAGTAAVIAPVAKPLARGARAAGGFAASPINKTAGGIAKVIGDKPETMMAQTLKQSTVLDAAQRAKNVNTALEGGYLPNKGGVERLKSDIMTTNSLIGKTIQNGQKSGTMVMIEDIIAPIEELKAKAIDSGADWGNNLATLDGIINSIRTNPKVGGGEIRPIKQKGAMGHDIEIPANFGGEIPVEVAQRWKVDVYKQLNDNVWGEFTSYAKEGRKALARGAKDVVAEALPEIAELNAKDSKLYGLQDVLERAANRIGNREGVGIGPAIKVGAGAAAGGGGMLAGAALAILEHPSVQPRIALALYRARKGAITMAESKSIVKERIGNIIKVKRAAKGQDVQQP